MKATESTEEDCAIIALARRMPCEADSCVILIESVIRQRIRDSMTKFRQTGAISPTDEDVVDCSYWLAQFVPLAPDVLATCTAAGIRKELSDAG